MKKQKFRLSIVWIPPLIGVVVALHSYAFDRYREKYT